MGRVGTEDPLQQHLILAGGGHSHALLLRRWAMEGHPRGVLITLVSRASTALYSGMVPGLIAGRYGRRETAIDLRRLCDRAGVRFVRAEITGLDPAKRELRLAGRPPLRWDRLSLDVGAVTPGSGGMAIKPLEPFLAWSESLAPGGAPCRVLGGGAAGVEVALALKARGLRVELVRRGDSLALGSPGANRAGERMLAAAGVALRNPDPEADVGVPADGPGPLVRCTGSRAPHWLAASGLPSDPATGRVFTEASLEVEGHPGVFACGDCGLVRSAPRPPSGVWAVRVAPVLAANLRRSLRGEPLRPWHPPRHALQLLGDGGAVDGQPRALAQWGSFCLGPSRWLWWCKAWIDRRFISRFQALAPMVEESPCRGCAAKLGAAPLRGALERLGVAAAGGWPADQGSPGGDDAAVIAGSLDQGLLLQSLDGFPALVGDDWLNGRLTALHACSDLWACGARVESVLALVTLPRGTAARQEEWLLQTLAGVLSVLDPLGARLVGGHTLEQRTTSEGLSLALSVTGRSEPGRFWAKGDLAAGDRLLLSRPIGSGVLFAGAMAGAAEPEWIDGALEVMAQSQQPLVELLAAHGCRACTDVTGFGLLGHLGEMLEAAAEPLRVALEPQALPAFSGALELLERGFASSLAPANRSAWVELETGRVQAAALKAPLRELLIDPQTCGPLLASMPAAAAQAALAAVRTAGFPRAELIGTVVAAPA
ncbi:selenide, water dikinase SelD [Synechococcus sp. CBW1107]|uniref:selenide, water dikinase SelD n=1 Tax=Synechococcus sp. CBW1107 TaxID=2789857 RepID=UPI002AD25288|nr:selenide, water dikinase SelD [Synechococcus sp. CBW1107]CAK6695695.1 Selenide, water dikinase [Synechococcus sp. CBW1107]